MRLFLLLVALSLLPRTADAIVQDSGDLLVEIGGIRDAMPGRESQGFDLPSPAELDDWRAVAGALLTHDFSAADSLVGADLSDYELVEFLDTGFQNRTYYLLREKLPVSRGWGTYMVNPVYDRSIMVQVPHPAYDLNTYEEGADLFRRTGSRFFLMAGTHRCASDVTSPCSGTTSACGDGTYHVSDVAHYTDSPFQAVHEVLDAGVRHLYVISLHGNGRSSCEDIFLSNGHASGSSALLYSLKNAVLAAGGLTVGVAGDGSSCPLIGSTNVQGRVTNGSTDPCVTAASGNGGYFIHIEQHREVRENAGEYGKLIDAVNQTIGTASGIVPSPRPNPAIALAPPRPNPGRAPMLQLSLAVEREITVEVFDVRGRRQGVVFRGVLQAGTHPLRLDTVSLPAGKYWITARGAGMRVARPWLKIP
jgi:hypothetical protein